MINSKYLDEDGNKRDNFARNLNITVRFLATLNFILLIVAVVFNAIALQSPRNNAKKELNYADFGNGFVISVIEKGGNVSGGAFSNKTRTIISKFDTAYVEISNLNKDSGTVYYSSKGDRINGSSLYAYYKAGAVKTFIHEAGLPQSISGNGEVVVVDAFEKLNSRGLKTMTKTITIRFYDKYLEVFDVFPGDDIYESTPGQFVSYERVRNRPIKYFNLQIKK